MRRQLTPVQRLISGTKAAKDLRKRQRLVGIKPGRACRFKAEASSPNSFVTVKRQQQDPHPHRLW
jgi:hypothetical protein